MTSGAGGRWRGPRPAVFAFALAGAGALWLGFGHLLPVMLQISHGAPLIALTPRAAMALPVGIAMLTFAAMEMFPPPDPGSRERRSSKQRAVPARRDWPVILFGFAGFCMILTLFAPLITETVVRATLQARGYIQCPDLPNVRRQPLRWARPASGQTSLPCPRG